MNSRSRVLTTIGHKEPDRVPYNLRPSPEMVACLRQEQNIPDLDFPDFFQHDIRYVQIPLPPCPKDTPEREWTPRPEPAAIAACAAQVRL